jgi:outer membrane protein OmpA-like peptidoglycan-associated protein
MTFRSLLLASAIVPFICYGGLAAAANREAGNNGLLLLAQNEEPCPEGQECPPPEQQPAEEQPVEEAEPEQPPAEEQPVEEAEPEQPPAEEQPVQEAEPEQPPAEEQPVEEAEPEQPPAEEQPVQEAEPEQPVEEEQPVQEAEPEQPPAEEQPVQEAEPEQPPAEEQPVQEAGPEQPPAEDNTVEQQLEAQGDTEEANRVRTLREQLLDQLLNAVAPPQQDRQRRDHDRDRSNRDRRDRYYDRDRDRGDVVEERGGRIIIDLGGGNIYVQPQVPDEGGRLLYGADNVEVQELPHGRTRTIVYRRNGVQIITVRDRYGDIVRRIKRLPDGREIVLIDNRFPEDDEGPRPPVIVDIPPPRVDIPYNRYIVDLGSASDEDLRYALQAPPVQELERPYTLDEVLRNEQIRAYQPRIDLDTITFDFGSATIGVDQMQTLFALGQAMEEIIAENPDEVYLIEGHTDAVGSDYDNLILSDRRAEAVAVALSQNFDIPPENLITEGYGEQYLKVQTPGPERQNRRATVRRLTDLLQAQN